MSYKIQIFAIFNHIMLGGYNSKQVVGSFSVAPLPCSVAGSDF